MVLIQIPKSIHQSFILLLRRFPIGLTGRRAYRHQDLNTTNNVFNVVCLLDSDVLHLAQIAEMGIYDKIALESVCIKTAKHTGTGMNRYSYFLSI